ncbi:MAG: cysteine desulfurase [Defluviitaleaceae bacterium]|nr:cysteine desulfurase [Defluviitaleaceae bacterium]
MIYLDHAATTPPTEAVKTAVLRSFEVFGNPSSLHKLGIEAEREIAHARDVLTKTIGANASEIIFTSGGTEANNLMCGVAKKHKGRRIITTKAEHPSVLEPLAVLKDFEFFYLPINRGGDVCHKSLREALKEPTCLVSIHHVNNETGVIQDIEALGKVIKQISPQTLFHVDAAQSFCKIPINISQMQIDLLTMSAHKIGGLKGVGALYLRKGVNLPPIIKGGGQESNLRSGTENVTGIMSFASATQSFQPITVPLKETFLNNLDLEGVDVNGENTSPYILNISVEGVRPEVLLNALSEQGVYISAGAACSANKKQKDATSAVVSAYGLGAKRAETAVRISFAHSNTLEEMTQTAQIFAQTITMLRKLRKL